MTVTADELLAAIGSPADLERLYRADPRGFAAVFPAARSRAADSPIVAVWHERLLAEATAGTVGASAIGAAESVADRLARPDFGRRPVVVTIVLALLAGTLVKLPAFFDIDFDWYSSRFPFPIVFSALAAYWLSIHRQRTGFAAAIAVACAASVSYLALLPAGDRSATVLLAQIHVPLVLWCMLGLAFAGPQWRSPQRRIDYLRYWGELIVYAAVILLGGIVLTGLTFALFHLISVRVEDFYRSFVVVYGVVAAPLVATCLYDAVLQRRSWIASLLANLFAPLFLVTVVAYLATMAFLQRSPYSDRDFLIALNGLLLLVLAITVLAVVQRPAERRRGLPDLIGIALVAVTLAVDAIALSAIVFRLSTLGLTPNRLAVLGANLLVFAHLGLLLLAAVAVFRGRAEVRLMEGITARFLPIYAAWVAIVAFAFPFAFRFA
ncbi:MAG: hypothetical protein AB7G13_33595 [Lautropia sp.]